MVANFDDSHKKSSDKPLTAVALKYDNTKNAAPKVVAKGQESLAKKILEIANEHDIPIHKDADLVQILQAVELEQEIPLEIYSVVAEVFAYIYRINKNRGV